MHKYETTPSIFFFFCLFIPFLLLYSWKSKAREITAGCCARSRWILGLTGFSACSIVSFILNNLLLFLLIFFHFFFFWGSGISWFFFFQIVKTVYLTLELFYFSAIMLTWLNYVCDSLNSWSQPVQQVWQEKRPPSKSEKFKSITRTLCITS